MGMRKSSWGVSRTVDGRGFVKKGKEERSGRDGEEGDERLVGGRGRRK